MRILFLIHRRLYSSFGLANSCNFIARLLHLQYPCEVVEVEDGNRIDQAVSRFKPTHVFIEALWVTPAKLKELARLHKHVIWIVRIHSHLPFLAQEGIALEWMDAYRKIANVFVGANDERVVREFSSALNWKVELLPTGYWPGYGVTHKPLSDEFGQPINIGCFGAVRPFKNLLTQAFAAVSFCRALARPVNFHINGLDIGPAYDSGPNVGAGVLKNLRSLFAMAKNARLIAHGWYPHRAFLEVINHMDVGMQVSFTETFNIVAADFAWNRIPIITSREMTWMDKRYVVKNPSDSQEVFDKLVYAYNERFGTAHFKNHENLKLYNAIAYNNWLDAIESYKVA